MTILLKFVFSVGLDTIESITVSLFCLWDGLNRDQYKALPKDDKRNQAVSYNTNFNLKYVNLKMIHNFDF